jgi:thymidylate synthase (FAD)
MSSSSSVKLVSYSQSPVGNDDDEENTLMDLVAYCARVSNPANQINKETNEKLLRYLMKNQHWSPLEMANVCLEINTTRDIGKQILRHRSFSFQEFSQRYAVVDMDFEIREARLQDSANRQNSIETDDLELNIDWQLKQRELAEKASEVYSWAIEKGIAKEQARIILPEGMTKTRMYMNGTLRSWIHYVQLRSANGTQKEHREIAIKCAEEIAKVFPLILEFVV